MPIQKDDLLKIRELLEKELSCETIKPDRKQTIKQELKTINGILNRT